MVLFIEIGQFSDGAEQKTIIKKENKSFITQRNGNIVRITTPGLE